MASTWRGSSQSPPPQLAARGERQTPSWHMAGQSAGVGGGCGQEARAELRALACACRVEGPGRSCVEGEGFLPKRPSKEPHFTDVSRGCSQGLRGVGAVMRRAGRLRDSAGGIVGLPSAPR